MPNVRMPDGAVVAFPDDMPAEQIRGMIAQKFPRVVAEATLAKPAEQRDQPSEAAMRSPISNKGLDAGGTFAAALPEGVPILGRALDNAATSASAGIGSLISGDPYQQVRSEMEGMKAVGNENHPVARLGGNITGSMAVLGPIAGTQTGAAALGLRGGTLGARALNSGLSSGAINMADTIARGGNGYDALKSGAAGLGLGMVLPVVGAGAGKVVEAGGDLLSKAAGLLNAKPPRVTVDELKAAGNNAYKASEAAGVVINKQGMNQLARNVVKDLTDHGFDPANEPGAAAALKRILANRDGNVTLKGLDTIRKVASNGYIPGNNSNNKVVSQIIGRIDELVNAADPATMAGLNTKAGVESLNAARSSWANARKLETVEKFAAKGEATGNSQINQDVQGATRRQVRQLLTNDAKARGFTGAELEAAKKAASMTPGMRTLRTVSGMFPSGKLGGMLHGGAGSAGLAALLKTGNPLPLILQGTGMAAGYAAKKGEEALSRKAFNEFADLIARGGKPLPQNALQKMISTATPEARRAIEQGVRIPLLSAILQGAH